MSEVLIRSEALGMALEAKVDPATHRITAIRGTGKPQGLLDALCEASLGHSVQDVSEHAVIRVESMLRGRGPRPVPGVVQPQNAGPQYVPLLALVRGLLQDYIARTGYKVSMNVEEEPVFQPSSEWGTSTVNERLQRILKAIPEVCVETGIRRGDVTVKSLAGPRVTLVLATGALQAAQQKYLTLLEMELRAKVDPRLEVFLDDKKDENTKRHAPCPA